MSHIVHVLTGMLTFSDKNKVGWEFVATVGEKLETTVL